ncbi:hypothetical protein [Paeniglutamicibacter sp. Y32M11]|uniref:hypothetical protein n=1 Tax=Paeniglutamicibacter sp. Y32M11 TaxID=2853258 RepID=UPI001C533588|nr:hypothetical protein [Paeniglutamicibacter sp. Y32M11]QXQ09009.1 hypothetical protein KUF55_10800 [Paeniglutamicibacter sp. Y32M11]
MAFGAVANGAQFNIEPENVDRTVHFASRLLEAGRAFAREALRLRDYVVMGCVIIVS